MTILNELDPRTAAAGNDNLLISTTENVDFKMSVDTLKNYIIDEASATQNGVVTTSAQEFAGNKTFKDEVNVERGATINNGLAVTGGLTVDGAPVTSPIDDTTVSEVTTYSSAKVKAFLNDITLSMVSAGNAALDTSSMTIEVNNENYPDIVDGMLCKLLITSEIQSSVAIDTVNIKMNGGTEYPIKVMSNNSLVNITSSQMTAGADYNASYPHRWCDKFTKLELTFCASQNCWIANGDDILMSYNAENEGYTKKTNGLIEQFGIQSKGSTLKAGSAWEIPIYLFLIYKNNYSVMLSNKTDSVSAGTELAWYNKTNSSFNVILFNRNGGNAMPAPSINWFATNY